MTFAKVGSNVDLTGGSFDSVDLTGTTIGAEIRLASKGYAAIDWSPAAKLVLRNVSAKALQDLPNAWPTLLDLEGFTYERLGGYRETENNDVAARESKAFIDWLAKEKQYSPQPIAPAPKRAPRASPTKPRRSSMPAFSGNGTNPRA
jgi:hypothetical protein